MQRDALLLLQVWRQQTSAMPLVLRGARQVGKSWLVRQFGKEFKVFIEINFERDQKAKKIFEGDLSGNSLLKRLAFYTGHPILPEQTLIFLDEIQECPAAITALRYFKEECPALHVIAAGSLLDFVLEKIGMPVGRVQFLNLYPLSFGEYLTACGRQDLREHLFHKTQDVALAALYDEYLKTYLWLGGMPAVLQSWFDEEDFILAQNTQDDMLTAYRQDFHKYAKKHQIDLVTEVFDAIALQLGRKFKYTQVGGEYRAAQLKQAALLLEKAGIIYRCFHSSGQGLPLHGQINEKQFKLFFFDVGLVQRLQGLDLKAWMLNDLKTIHGGPIAEQFVAQEWLSNAYVRTPSCLYYWHREGRNTNAEVDFLFTKNGKVIPVEVKSGKQGGLKSLWQFLETHPQSPKGLKIARQFSRQARLEEIPLYAVEAWVKSERGDNE